MSIILTFWSSGITRHIVFERSTLPIHSCSLEFVDWSFVNRRVDTILLVEACLPDRRFTCSCSQWLQISYVPLNYFSMPCNSTFLIKYFISAPNSVHEVCFSLFQKLGLIRDYHCENFLALHCAPPPVGCIDSPFWQVLTKSPSMAFTVLNAVVRSSVFFAGRGSME